MKILVTGQNATIKEREKLVANSVKIYTCSFEFDSSWDGFGKTAVFKVGYSTPAEMVVASNECTIPYEVLKQGKLHIGVYGINDDKVMPTVWCEPVEVLEGTPKLRKQLHDI